MKRRCANPNCAGIFTPDSEHRYGDFCSAACATIMTPKPRRAYSVGWGKPNTSLTVLGKPAVNRMHGTDRKVQS